MKSTLAQVLSKLRRDKNLSQREAANALGVSQALLSHYENNAREPKLDFIIRACDYYNVSADFILGRTETRNCVSPQVIENAHEIVNTLIDMKISEANLISELDKLFSV